MTVSANSTLNYTRDQLITVAFRYAGVLSAGRDPSSADIAMASDFMNLELMTLQAEGVILRTIERTTLTLGTPDDGDATYNLPAGTIDVENSANGQAGTIVPTEGAETVVSLMSRDEYLALPDKSDDTTGRPTKVYIEKLATLTATFWPVPDSTCVSFRYARVRLLQDLDSGGVTVDLARRWLQAVTYAVAAQIAMAKSLGPQVAGYLRSEANRLKAICRSDDTQRGAIRFRLKHSGRRW